MSENETWILKIDGESKEELAEAAKALCNTIARIVFRNNPPNTEAARLAIDELTLHVIGLIASAMAETTQKWCDVLNEIEQVCLRNSI